MKIFSWLFGGTTGDASGVQRAAPSVQLSKSARPLTPELALQVSTVHACVNLLAETIASLPLFVYLTRDGERTLARESYLWFLLHDSPNRHMTPSEFWRAMIMQLCLRGNAYALVDRTDAGEPSSLYPLATDQMTVYRDGEDLLYRYVRDGAETVYRQDQILHLKGLGNGIVGLSRLDYMAGATTECLNAQETASGLYGAANKPTGILTVDHVINREQRDKIKGSFEEMRTGASSGLFVLEADMKYQQLSLTPAEAQLLETRKYSVNEIARWFGVHPALIGADAQMPGGGIDSALELFYKLTVRPIVVGIEQAVRKSVMTPAQRQMFTAEFQMDALLRASELKRYEIYSKATQNGLMTRNECRQLENLPPMAGGDDLTVQTNLVPVEKLGQVTPSLSQTPVGEVSQ